jgi:hypothetical protein
MGANLIRNPEAADVFRVAGVALPGIANVTGCEDASKLDVKAGSGTKGATIGYQGSEPKDFTVELHLMDEDQYDEWLDGEGRRILLTPPTGKTPKAFAVDHPSCLECSIKSAVKKTVSAAEKVGDGSYKVKIVLTPASPPTPAHGTPAGSQTKWHEPASKDAADKAIDDLVAQAKALAA